MIVMAGFQDFSSSRIERQTVPEGYTFGWNNGGVNLPDKGRLSIQAFSVAKAFTFGWFGRIV